MNPVLDLGCGYLDFISQLRRGRKYGMALRPRECRFLDDAVPSSVDVLLLKPIISICFTLAMRENQPAQRSA